MEALYIRYAARDGSVPAPLRDALDQLMAAQSHEPTTEDRASALVTLQGSRDGDWIEVTEEHASELALELSRKTSAAVVLLGEMDDMLDATLFVDGVSTDRHQILDGGELRPGTPDAWARALGDPTVLAPLQKAFRIESAAEAYDAIAQALRLWSPPPRQVDLLTQMRAVAAAAPEQRTRVLENTLGAPGDASSLEWTETLAYRPTAAPTSTEAPRLHRGAPSDLRDEELAEPSLDQAREMLRGLSALLGRGIRLSHGLEERTPALRLELGERRTIREAMHNRAGVLRRLSLEVSGSAIDEGLVRVADLQIEHDGAVVRAEGDGKLFRVDGLAIPGAPSDRRARSRDEERQTLIVSVVLEPLAAGRGALALRVQAKDATTPPRQHGYELEIVRARGERRARS
jgi:hypothetical protein